MLIIRDSKRMQETQPGTLASELDRSTSRGSSFVKSVGGKARSLLNTLERSFSSSSTERGEDVSYMTIEFLYMRLQAQRMINKAEKQRVQQLERKVTELEQKLDSEIARRKKAEGNDVLVSAKHESHCVRTKDSCYCNTKLCTMNEEGMENRLNIGSSHVEGDACYTSEQHAGWMKSRIDGGAVHQMDRGEIYQSFLCHQCGCHKNSKQVPSQQWSSVDKRLNATFNQYSSDILLNQGTRESMDSGPDSEEHEANDMLEMTQTNSSTKYDTHGADSQSEIYKIDIEDLEASDKYKIASLNFQETLGVSHRFPSGDLSRKALTLQQPANNSSIESLDCTSLRNSSSLVSRGTIRELLQQSSARAISSPRDSHDRVLEGIMSSPKKISIGAFTDSSISSLGLREHGPYNNRRSLKLADECFLHGYITAESESSKEIEEDRGLARGIRKQDS